MDKITVRDFTPRYAKLCVGQRRNRPQYLENKMAMIEKVILPRFGNMELQAITQLDVDEWVGHLCTPKDEGGMGLSPKTANNYITIFRNMNRTASKYFEVNPHLRLERLKEDEVVTHELTPEQVEKLVATIKGDVFKAMVVVAVNTGLRIGELRALQWDRVDWRRKVLVIDRSFCGRGNIVGKPKGKSRDVPFNRKVEDVLKQLDRTTKFVFMRPRDKFDTTSSLTYKACDHAISLARRTMGGTAKTFSWLSWHVLRHTFACNLARSGKVQLMEIRDLLGHVDLKTTLRYARLMPSALARAVAVLDDPA